MGNASGIDFGTTVPETPETYANAFQVGLGLAKQGVADNAMTANAADPSAPVDPRLAAADPAAYAAIQARQAAAGQQASLVTQAGQVAGGDTQGAMNTAAARGDVAGVTALRAQIDAVPEQQRKAAIEAAQQRNDQTAHVLAGLKGYQNPDGSLATPEQRLGIAQHLAQTSGLLDPSTITLNDVTDSGINAHLAMVVTADQWLKNAHEQATLAETGRAHDLEHQDRQGTQSIERGKLGVDQARLGLEVRKYRDEQAGSGAGGGLPAPAAPGAQATATISQVPASDRAIVQALIDGRYPIPTGAALRNPQMVRYLTEAAAIDPTFDAANAATRVGTRKDFLDGASAKNMTSMRTTLGHLGRLSTVIDQLHNGSATPLNWAGNAFSGVAGEAPTSNFQAVATTAATELSRTLQGGAPTESEIKHWRDLLSQNKSPAQLHGVVSQMAGLLKSRLDQLEYQYRQGMGPSSTPLHVLNPETAEIYQQLSGLGAARPPAGAPPHPAAPHAAGPGGRSQIIGVTD